MIIERTDSTTEIKQITPEPISERAPLPRIPINDRFGGFDFVEGGINFHSGPQKRSGLKLALWTWLSAGIDTLILISMSCFFMVAFSFLMQSPARKILGQFVQQPDLLSMFLTVFVINFWIYLISTRIFMGASLGEWACQLRLGQPSQRMKLNYIFLVMVRTTLILVTGVITFPLLSLLLDRDVVGDITGIKIYSLT